jgi:hypothetical protein
MLATPLFSKGNKKHTRAYAFSFTNEAAGPGHCVFRSCNIAFLVTWVHSQRVNIWAWRLEREGPAGGRGLGHMMGLVYLGEDDKVYMLQESVEVHDPEVAVCEIVVVVENGNADTGWRRD